MGKMIIISRDQKNIPAYLVEPEKAGKYPAIILIHEVWGLNDHIKDVANRLSQVGYVVIAPDLLVDTGIYDHLNDQLMKRMFDPDPEIHNDAQKELRFAMAPTQSPTFAEETIKSIQTVFDYVRLLQSTTNKTGIIGYCFGGSYAYAFAVKQPLLSAVIPFYGYSDHSQDDIEKITAPVLAFYGEKDSALINALPGLIDKMNKANKQFKHKIYPNTGHAFFNDTNSMSYNKAAADDAWQETLMFLQQNLA